MEIDGRGSQPASLNVMSSARRNAVEALLRALKESKLHKHTSDALKEYLGPAMSFRYSSLENATARLAALLCLFQFVI